MGFIDYVDHETKACGAAKITYKDAVITMSDSESSLGSCTDNEEANVSKTERLSISETSSIPAPYSFEHSNTESDSSSEN